jgi:hypothetical protein
MSKVTVRKIVNPKYKGSERNPVNMLITTITTMTGCSESGISEEIVKYEVNVLNNAPNVASKIMANICATTHRRCNPIWLSQNWVPRNVAFLKLAPRKSARLKSAPDKSWPRKSAPRKFAP